MLVSAPDIIPYQARLYSADGQLLQTGDVQGHESKWSLRDYPPGLYFLKATTAEGNAMSGIIRL